MAEGAAAPGGAWRAGGGVRAGAGAVVALMAMLVVALLPDAAQAACDTFTPTSGQTVTCSGANTTGVLADTATGVTVIVPTGGSIIPTLNTNAIWLGADADITVASGATVGNAANSSYAIDIGDGATVVVNGTVTGGGGIIGPDHGGITGFAGAHITINQGGEVVANDLGNYALKQRFRPPSDFAPNSFSEAP